MAGPCGTSVPQYDSRLHVHGSCHGDSGLKPHDSAMVQGDRDLYAAAKSRQNVEAAWECTRVAEAALAANEGDRAVRLSPLPAARHGTIGLRFDAWRCTGAKPYS